MLIGPNTGLGHTSVVVMAEYQTAYVLDALRVMDERHLLSVEIRPEMQAVYNDEVQRRLGHRVDGRRLPQLVPRRLVAEHRPVAGPPSVPPDDGTLRRRSLPGDHRR